MFLINSSTLTSNSLTNCVMYNHVFDQSPKQPSSSVLLKFKV